MVRPGNAVGLDIARYITRGAEFGQLQPMEKSVERSSLREKGEEGALQTWRAESCLRSGSSDPV